MEGIRGGRAPVAERAAVRLLNYPAWQVRVNGQVKTAESARGTEQLIVPLPAGKDLVEVRFVETPDRKVGAGAQRFGRNSSGSNRGRGETEVRGNRELAAIRRRMTHVVACDDVDDIFGDVGGVIGDALDILGDQNQLERLKYHCGIAHHVAQKLAKDLIAQAST